MKKQKELEKLLGAIFNTFQSLSVGIISMNIVDSKQDTRELRDIIGDYVDENGLNENKLSKIILEKTPNLEIKKTSLKKCRKCESYIIDNEETKLCVECRP